MKKSILFALIIIFCSFSCCLAGTYTITTSDSDETTLQWALNKHNTQLTNLPAALANNKNFKAPAPIDEPTFISNIIKKEINRINTQMNNENVSTLQNKFNKANPTIQKQIQDLLK